MLISYFFFEIDCIVALIIDMVCVINIVVVAFEEAFLLTASELAFIKRTFELFKMVT
jgi:hypothetical protein